MWLKSFFLGMSPMGYVIAALIAALMISWTSMFFMTRNIQKLNRELGAQTVTINTLVQGSLDNLEDMQQLEQLLNECAKLRQAADNRAEQAVQELHRKTLESMRDSDGRSDEVAETIKEQSPVCTPRTLPSRSTELLIESAVRANRGADSP